MIRTALPPSTRNDVLDVARLAAAFGVILIHCGPTTFAGSRVVAAFQNFAVPFFLLSSLYLFWREVQDSASPGAALWRRLPRLLWPYAAWSGIYYAARVGKAALQHQPLESLVARDTVLHVIGAGAAAVQLYFLPFLLCGLLLAAALAALNIPRMRELPLLGALLMAGLVLRPWVPQSASGLGHATPLLLTYAGWFFAITSPVGAAGLFARFWPLTHSSPRRGLLALAVFALVDALATAELLPLGWAAQSLVLSSLLLLTCLHLGAHWRAAPGLAALARTAFGVFLVHHLFIEAIEFADTRWTGGALKPYTVPAQFAVATLVLALSAGSSWAIGRHVRLRQYLLGH